LVGKPERKSLLEEGRSKWRNDDKFVLKEIMCNVTGWIQVCEDRD
jgi:hypothetical protein